MIDFTVIAILVSSVIGLLAGEIIEDVDIINVITEDSDG
jgi:hypothetical protein